MTLHEIGNDAVEAAHYIDMLDRVDSVYAMRYADAEDGSLTNARREYAKCKECGRFVSKGRPCSLCPVRGKFLIQQVEAAGTTAPEPWEEEKKTKAKATIRQLLAEMHTTGRNGLGKGWKNHAVAVNTIGDKTAQEFAAANPNLRVSPGMDETIDINQLKHTLEEHGVNGRHRQPFEVPIQEADLLLIPDVMSDYATVEAGLGRSDGKKQEGIELWKCVGDGVYLCVIVDQFNAKEGKPQLKFQTMIKFERQTDESLA